MSVPASAAPFLASSGLLMAAGLAKIARPDFTARALRQAGLPSKRLLVRAGATAELGAGAAALLLPGAVTGGLVASAYVAFSLFIAVALRRHWPLSSCGCFGRPDSQPSSVHLALDLAAAASAVAWSAQPPASLAGSLSAQPWGGWPLILVSTLVAALAYIVWTNPLARVKRS